MALTDIQKDWLNNDNVRVVLVEAAYVGEPLPLYCNNNNTDPDYPDIYCNDEYIPEIKSYIYCNATSIIDEIFVSFFSNIPYVSDFGISFTDVAGNTVQDIAYDDILESIPNIASRIDSSSTLGSLSFYNTDGEFDSYLTRAWEGWPIRILIGSPLWSRTDFIQVFDGLINSFTAPTTEKLNIQITNKNDILTKTAESSTITTQYVRNKLALATEFSLAVEVVPIVGDPLASIEYDPTTVSVPDSVLNTRVPMCVGKCYNVAPVLIDAYNHVYLIHDGPITSILEIDGVPQIKSNGLVLNGVAPVSEGDPALQYEIDLNIGCIRLLDHARSTLITVDVDGAANRGSGYDTAPENVLTKNSAAWIMEWLALEKSPLISTDLDYTSFTAIDALNDSELGLFYKDEADVGTLMTSIISSIGGYYRFNRESKLELTILDIPANLPAPTVTLEQDYIVQNGLSLGAVEIPKSQLTMSYQKNWTVIDTSSQAGVLNPQPGDTTGDVVNALATSEILASEYQTLTAVNGGVKLKFPLAETNETTETLIFYEVDALDEITRRAVVRSQKRYVYKLESIVPPLELSVGDTVTIIYDRFEFDDPGVIAVVIGLSEKVTNNRVDIEVWL